MTNEIQVLLEELDKKPKSFKGRDQFIKLINKKKKKLASLSLTGQLSWLLQDSSALASYRKSWLRQKAAQELGISERTLYRKIKEFEL